MTPAERDTAEVAALIETHTASDWETSQTLAEAATPSERDGILAHGRSTFPCLGIGGVVYAIGARVHGVDWARRHASENHRENLERVPDCHAMPRAAPDAAPPRVHRLAAPDSTEAE